MKKTPKKLFGKRKLKGKGSQFSFAEGKGPEDSGTFTQGETRPAKGKGKGKKVLGIVGGALEAIGAGLTSGAQTMGGDSYASGVSNILAKKAASRSGFQLKSGNNAAFKDIGAEKKEELDEATRRALYRRAKNRGDKKGMKIYAPKFRRINPRETKGK
jgi:hypothetical protein